MRRMVAVAALLALAACNGDREAGGPESQSPPSAEERLNERLSGTMRIATAPVTQPLASRAAANFETETPVEVEVSETGSRAALARLCAGEVTMAAVDRPIRAELRRACRRNDMDLLRIDIGRLAVSVVASSELGLGCMSLSELRRVWRPGSRVDRYRLYGAAPGSAAFELFTRTVNGREDRIRAGWTPIEDAARFGLRLADDERALAFVNREVLKPRPEGVDAVALDARPGLYVTRPTRHPGRALPADSTSVPVRRPVRAGCAADALVRPFHGRELRPAGLHRPDHRAGRRGHRRALGERAPTRADTRRLAGPSGGQSCVGLDRQRLERLSRIVA